MTAVIVLAVLVAVVFGMLGLAKVLAVPRMRVLASKAGFSTAAYRRIGVLELAGAAGVALGLVVPLLGVLAAAGLLCLLAGALTVHLRRREAMSAVMSEVMPAVVCAVLVGSYAAVLVGATG